MDRDEALADQAERGRICCASATQVLPQGQDERRLMMPTAMTADSKTRAHAYSAPPNPLPSEYLISW